MGMFIIAVIGGYIGACLVEYCNRPVSLTPEESLLRDYNKYLEERGFPMIQSVEEVTDELVEKLNEYNVKHSKS